MIHDAHVADVGAALPLKDAAARVTDAYLRQGCERVMAATGGNVEQAARLAGYTGRGFRDVLKRLGLRTTDESESS